MAPLNSAPVLQKKQIKVFQSLSATRYHSTTIGVAQKMPLRLFFDET